MSLIWTGGGAGEEGRGVGLDQGKWCEVLTQHCSLWLLGLQRGACSAERG